MPLVKSKKKTEDEDAVPELSLKNDMKSARKAGEDELNSAVTPQVISNKNK